MAMTKIERIAQDQITDILGKEGYPTYAHLFRKFDLNLTEDPNVVAFMQPQKARIVVNKNLTINQVSTVIRHEILHEYLTHMERYTRWEERTKKKLPQLLNVAADFEISNRGYTDRDKANVRSLMINGKLMRGLVTEDEFPGWENKSLEEMLDLLSDEKTKLDDNIIQSGDLIGEQNADREIQEAEEIARQAEEMARQAESMKSDDEAIESDNAEKVKRNAEEVAKAMEKNKSEDGEVFKEDGEVKKQKELEDRLDEIKKAFSELKNNELFRETETEKEKEYAVKKAKDLAKYKDNPLNRFSASLSSFIKKEIAYGRGSSWSKINKNYTGSGLIKPGISRMAPKKVPLINVYFDCSGSFSGYPEKFRSAERVLATLNKYEKAGLLKIDLYYASSRVYEDKSKAVKDGYGMESDPVINHITNVKPDNVIIVTDSDADSGYKQIKVPGGVWLLFYESSAPSLLNRIKGSRMTHSYLITESDF